MTPTERLQELAEELRRGKVVEARLRAESQNEHIDGLCDFSSQIIYIDSRPAVVETLIHELCHRRWPSWSEARVERESRRLIAWMSPDDVFQWYRLYERAKRIRKSVKRVEESD